MADNSIKIKKGSVYEKFTDPFYLNTFIEFYHTHSNEECQSEYNITHSTMYRIIKQFDIPTRTKEELEQINLRLYGVTNVGNKASAVEKRKKNNLKKYGCEHVTQSESFKAKAAKTKLEKYGDEHFVNPQKGLQTKRERYDENYFGERLKATMQERYGVDNPSQLDWVQEYKRKNFIENHGMSFSEYMSNVSGSEETLLKRHNTCVERYGENYASEFAQKASSHVDHREIYAKGAKTCLERYGVENFGASQQAIAKSKNTRLLQKKEMQEYAKNNNLILLSDIMDKYYINSMAIQTFLDRNNIKPGKLGNYSYITEAEFEIIEPLILNWVSATHSRSMLEEEVLEFIKSIYHGIIKLNDRTVLSPKELDIYIPDKQLAIEVDGLYYHSSMNRDFRSNNKLSDEEFESSLKNKHYQKSKDCRDKGIRLIHIYEHEWRNLDKQQKIKSLLSIALGVVPSKIYARKCTIKQITNKEAKVFNDKNHLQGHRNAQVTYGLFYNNELVQLMSFSKSRYNKNLKDNNSWEIIRGCPGSNNIVVGGVSKLFKHFVKEYNPSTVFSYCDFNKFDGKGYVALGMQYVGDTGPDLNWVIRLEDLKSTVEDRYIVVPRSPSKHKQLSEKSCGKFYGSGSMKFEWHKQ